MGGAIKGPYLEPDHPRRLNIPRGAMLVGVARGHETQRRQAEARLSEGLEAAIAPFGDAVPLEQLRAALLPLLREADLRGYQRGCKHRRNGDRPIPFRGRSMCPYCREVAHINPDRIRVHMARCAARPEE